MNRFSSCGWHNREPWQLVCVAITMQPRILHIILDIRLYLILNAVIDLGFY
jgi:hypothetical protein